MQARRAARPGTKPKQSAAAAAAAAPKPPGATFGLELRLRLRGQAGGKVGRAGRRRQRQRRLRPRRLRRRARPVTAAGWRRHCRTYRRRIFAAGSCAGNSDGGVADRGPPATGGRGRPAADITAAASGSGTARALVLLRASPSRAPKPPTPLKARKPTRPTTAAGAAAGTATRRSPEAAAVATLPPPPLPIAANTSSRSGASSAVKLRRKLAGRVANRRPRPVVGPRPATAAPVRSPAPATVATTTALGRARQQRPWPRWRWRRRSRPTWATAAWLGSAPARANHQRRRRSRRRLRWWFGSATAAARPLTALRPSRCGVSARTHAHACRAAGTQQEAERAESVAEATGDRRVRCGGGGSSETRRLPHARRRLVQVALQPAHASRHARCRRYYSRCHLPPDWLGYIATETGGSRCSPCPSADAGALLVRSGK